MWIQKKTVYWPSEKNAVGKVVLSTVTQIMISRYYRFQDEIDAHLIATYGEEDAKADPMPPDVARAYLRLMRAAAVLASVVGIFSKDGGGWKEESIPENLVEAEGELPAMLVIECRRAVDEMNPGLFGRVVEDEEAEKNDDSAS